MADLPGSWIEIEMLEAAINVPISNIKIPQKDYFPEGKFPIFDQGQSYIGGYTSSNNNLVNCNLPVILFGDHTRVVKYIDRPFAPGADGIKILQPRAFIHARLFEYFVAYIAKKIPNKGYARHFQLLAKEKIPLPPTREQDRILEKIEELFSELDKGVENLKLAQEQLKIYRQALLRDAFVGKLTTQWRINNGEPLESAGTLLEQIQFEREKNYQHQIASWEALGKKGAKPKPPKLLLELSPEEFGNLPKLASGWTWVKLGDIADLRGGITKGKNLDGKASTTLPYLRVANVQDGYLNLNLIKQIAVLVDEENKYKLQKGDVLYTEGGDKDKLGRGAVWNCEIDDCIHQNHIFRARIFSNLYVPDLLAAYSRTQEAKNYFFKHAKQTTNLASINLGVLTNLPIPMCCANEQKEVLNILNSTFAIAENIEKDLNDSIKRSELLRQSILQKAFSGQLVPQDPNDEPASELLPRIKAEVAKSKPIKKKKAA